MSNILEIMNCRSNSNMINELNYVVDDITRRSNNIIRMINDTDENKLEEIRKIFETT